MTSVPSESERLEALSRRYSPDAIRLRQLESGRWAVYGADHGLLGCATSLDEVLTLTQHLRLAAEVGRQRLEAELAANRRRASDLAALDSIDIDELELDLE